MPILTYEDFFKGGVDLGDNLFQMNYDYGTRSSSFDYMKFITKFLTDKSLRDTCKDLHDENKRSSENNFKFYKSEEMWCDKELLEFIRTIDPKLNLINDKAESQYNIVYKSPDYRIYKKAVKAVDKLMLKDRKHYKENYSTISAREPAWKKEYPTDLRFAKILRRVLLPLCTTFDRGYYEGKYRITWDMLDDKAKLSYIQEGKNTFPSEGIPLWEHVPTRKFYISFGYVDGDTTKLHKLLLSGNGCHMTSLGGTGFGKSVALTAYLLLLTLACPPWELEIAYMDAKRVDAQAMSLQQIPTFRVIAPTKSVAYSCSVVQDFSDENDSKGILMGKIGVNNSEDLFSKIGICFPKLHMLIDEIGALVSGGTVESVKGLIKNMNSIYQKARALGGSLHWFSQVVPGKFSDLEWGNIMRGACLGCTEEASKQSLGNKEAALIDQRGIMLVNEDRKTDTSPNIKVYVPFANQSDTNPKVPNHISLLGGIVRQLCKEQNLEGMITFNEETPVLAEEVGDKFLTEVNKGNLDIDSAIPLGASAVYTPNQEPQYLRFRYRDNNTVYVHYQGEDELSNFMKCLAIRMEYSLNNNPSSIGGIRVYSQDTLVSDVVKNSLVPYLSNYTGVFDESRHLYTINSTGDNQLTKIIDWSYNLSNSRIDMIDVENIIKNTLKYNKNATLRNISNIMFSNDIEEREDILSNVALYVAKTGMDTLSVFRGSKLMMARCFQYQDWFSKGMFETIDDMNMERGLSEKAIKIQKYISGYLNEPYNPKSNIQEFEYNELNDSCKEYLEFKYKDELDKAIDRERKVVDKYNEGLVSSKTRTFKFSLDGSEEIRGENKKTLDIDSIKNNVMKNKLITIRELATINFITTQFIDYHSIDSFYSLIKIEDFPIFYIIINDLEKYTTNSKDDISTRKFTNLLVKIKSFSSAGIRVIFTTTSLEGLSEGNSSYLGSTIISGSTMVRGKFTKGLEVDMENIRANIPISQVLVENFNGYTATEYIPISM